MKKLILSCIMTALASVAFAEGETTKVCVDVKDAKGNVVKDAKGNPKQNCKTMKAHKKLEGHEVPAKK